MSKALTARIVDTDEELDVMSFEQHQVGGGLLHHRSISYALTIRLNQPCTTLVPDTFTVESEHLMVPVVMCRGNARELISYHTVPQEVIIGE